eukprot:2680675-Pyramimonas_sp.AAC.1
MPAQVRAAESGVRRARGEGAHLPPGLGRSEVHHGVPDVRAHLGHLLRGVGEGVVALQHIAGDRAVLGCPGVAAN